MADSVKIQEESDDSSRLLDRSVSNSQNDELFICIENLERIEINLSRNSEEDFAREIVRTNEVLIDLIKSNRNKEAHKILERIEKLLERKLAASRGKNLDRNLIIVILFNIAANFQAMWQLEKCGTYIEAAVYNAIRGVKDDEDMFKSLLNTAPKTQLEIRELNEDLASFQGRLLKKYSFIIKSLLQYCAVLSQLSQHEVAMKNAYKASEYLKKQFILLQEICNEQRNTTTSLPTSRSVHTSSTQSVHNSTQKLASPHKTIKPSNHPLLREEIPFSRLIIEYSSPILDEIVAHTVDFDPLTTLDIFIETKRSFYNWKNNPENNERQVRKEFKVLKSDWIQENRSLIGVAHQKDWISNLNIGTIMHMSPLSYYEVVSPEEHIFYLSKDQIMEKIIHQSICFFTISTEMRFIDMAQSKQANSISKTSTAPNSGQTSLQSDVRSEKHKVSEIYHLKSIEMVCKYIPSPCPYINHLISSYQKHYNQNLETIPEESLSVASSKPISPRDPLDFADSFRYQQQMKLESQSQCNGSKLELLRHYESQNRQSSEQEGKALSKNYSATLLTEVCTTARAKDSFGTQKTPASIKTVTEAKVKMQSKAKPPTPSSRRYKTKAEIGSHEEHKVTPKAFKEEERRPATSRNNYEEWLEIIDIMNQREKRKRSAERGKPPQATSRGGQTLPIPASKTPKGTAKAYRKPPKTSRGENDPPELSQQTSYPMFHGLQTIDLSVLKTKPNEKDGAKRVQTPNQRSYLKKQSATPVQRGELTYSGPSTLLTMTNHRTEHSEDGPSRTMMKSWSNHSIPLLNLQKISKIVDSGHHINHQNPL